MNNLKPLVSVLICSYNAEKFIESTIHSILSQTYQNIELLVLDNGSDDKTLEILYKIQNKDKRLHVFAEKTNLGPYLGLNYLLDKTRSPYIAINDHDDIWHSEKLEKQVLFLEAHKEYIGCGTAIVNWYEKYNKSFYRSQNEKSDITWHTSLVFRNLGFRYNTSVKVATDFYFMKNILSGNKMVIYNFPEPLVLRRIFMGKQNLSGQWMKRGSIKDILNLKIGLFDKLALLNRYLIPQEWVERFVIWRYRNNIPKQFDSYSNTLLSSLTNRG